MTTAARRRVYARYPETDYMGEHELQRLIAELLRPLLERWFASRGELAHVGADQFFYWVEGDPTQRVAPDVYVVPGVSQEPPVASWKLWELKARPSFAFEVVGQDIDKDYDDNPVLYGVMGVKELVLFDPHATPKSHRRLRWQVFRRVKGRGLVRVEVSSGDRVRSKVLGCWLRERTSVRHECKQRPRWRGCGPSSRRWACRTARASCSAGSAATSARPRACT